jgi:hypothetical protein
LLRKAKTQESYTISNNSQVITRQYRVVLVAPHGI